MLMTCLISTTTLGLQPAWFTPFHLFWTEKLLYFVFVDIFHSLVIPLMMARTIPWENPKGERGKSTFYVRQTKVLEPRRPISIQSGTRPSVEPDRMKTSSLIKPTTLLLPADTAPWIPTPMEEGTLEKFSRLQEGRKVPDYCKHCSFPFFRGTKSEDVSDESESEKNTRDNQEAFDASQYLQEQNLFNLITQVQNWKHFCPCVMRLSESNQNLKSTEKSQFCSLFPKQAFRSRLPRKTECGVPTVEMRIWKSRNEFGQRVLRYSRHHGSPAADLI